MLFVVNYTNFKQSSVIASEFTDYVFLCFYIYSVNLQIIYKSTTENVIIIGVLQNVTIEADTFNINLTVYMHYNKGMQVSFIMAPIFKNGCHI